jgi:hypothetical protein
MQRHTLPILEQSQWHWNAGRSLGIEILEVQQSIGCRINRDQKFIIHASVVGIANKQTEKVGKRVKIFFSLQLFSAQFKKRLNNVPESAFECCAFKYELSDDIRVCLPHFSEEISQSQQCWWPQLKNSLFFALENSLEMSDNWTQIHIGHNIEWTEHKWIGTNESVTVNLAHCITEAVTALGNDGFDLRSSRSLHPWRCPTIRNTWKRIWKCFGESYGIRRCFFFKFAKVEWSWLEMVHDLIGVGAAKDDNFLNTVCGKKLDCVVDHGNIDQREQRLPR